jgi:cysteine desulfurase/selenocysteine lyase
MKLPMSQAIEILPEAHAADLSRYRKDFPILATTVRGKPLVYLDNGATTQKPAIVIETLERFYREHNANIHRGVYTLSQEATDAYEWARRRVAKFINAAENEVVFTRGTTEAINLVAATWGRSTLKSGDEIILSTIEHHSNIVPWQLIAEATGAVIHVIPVNEAGELLLDEYEKLLSPRTKMVAVCHVSNSLGTINDVRRIVDKAHEVGALTLIDGAQWVAHHPTDVRELGCDFYAFSGHKLFGPTGIGVLFGKAKLLEAMPPYQGGGDMIESVSFKKTLYARPPARFEAGTPNIAGAIGLAAAIDYVESVGFDQIVRHETALLEYATEQLGRVPGLRIVGTAKSKATVISFVLEDPAVPILQIGMELDRDGIAVRTGHHCCQPLMDRMNIPGTSRISMAFYNTRAEIDAAGESLLRITQEASVTKAAPKREESPTNGELAYPAATAPSIEAAAEELAENFDALEDRDAKNEYVLELGARLPNTFSLLKKVTPRVAGCMAEVYLVPRRKPGTTDVVEFVADADAPIVRGLIALLESLYSGQSAAAILKYDVESFFRRIGLDAFISSQRRNGLSGMIQRIRQAAQSIGQTS